MASEPRVPLQQISTNSKENIPPGQIQKTFKSGISHTKNMIAKPPLKPSINSSSIPQPPSIRRQTLTESSSRRTTLGRARSGVPTNEETPVNKRLAATPKRSFPQARKDQPASANSVRSGARGNLRNTLSFNKVAVSRASSRSITRKDLSSSAHMTEISAKLESLENSFTTLFRSNNLSVGKDVGGENVPSKNSRLSTKESNEEVEKLLPQLKHSQQALDQLRSEMISTEKEAKERVVTLESQLDNSTIRLKDLMRQLEFAESERSSCEAVLRRSKRENEELQSEREEMEGTMKKRMKLLKTEKETSMNLRLEIEQEKTERRIAEEKARQSFESYKHDFEPRLAELQKEKEHLRKANAGLQADLSTKNQQFTSFEESFALQERKMIILKSNKTTFELRIENLQADLVSSSTEVQRLLQVEQDQQREIEKLEKDARDNASERRRLHNTIQELKGNIRVFCRIRPPLPTEVESLDSCANRDMFQYIEKGQGIVMKAPKEIKDSSGRTSNIPSYPFKFDRVFDPTSSQDTVFEDISQLVQSAIDGYRVCIFAYGQTGSGKTYTMFGENEGSESNLGMIPRSIQQIFQTSKAMEKDGWTYELKASFLEIYNESIKDLLVDSGTSSNGKAKDHKISISPDTKLCVVSDLTVVHVVDESHIEKMIKQSMNNRATAATRSNERSSRSHSVFRLYVTGTNSGTGERRDGLLNLIDLAGSERLEKSKAEGKRLLETRHINKSLSALGDVISSIANKEPHTPFRNSKLTYLLQDSLGGDSKALMFVNVSHAPDSFNESLCSLRFAAKVNSCHVGTAKRSAKMVL